MRRVRRLAVVSLAAVHSFCFADVAALRTQANAAFENGRYSEAESALRTLLKSTPEDPAALGFLAAVLDREDKLAEADPLYKRALRLSPSSVFFLNNYGNHCELAGEPALAEEQYRKVIALEPAHRNANLHLARLAVARQDGASALQYLARAGGADPNDFSVELIRAEALYWAGDRQQSQALLDALMERTPGELDDSVSIAAALVRMRQYRRAFPLLAQLRRQAPESKQVLLLMAKSLDQLNRLNEAAVAYDAYLKLAPEDEYARRERAFLMVRRADLAGGLPELKRFHTRHPNDPEGAYELAVATSVTDMQEALRLLNQTLGIAPRFTAARYARAAAFQALNQLPEAARDLEQASMEEPDNPQIASALGSVYLALNEPAKATAILRQAQQHSPQDRSVLVVLSRALKMQNHPEEAQAVLAQIPETAPVASSSETGLLKLLNLDQ